MTITQEHTRPGRAGPSTVRPVLGALGLLDLVADYVAETAAVLPVAPANLTARHYELLERSDHVEIWAIHWPQGQGLELHDHGGSVGALWVVNGSLEEHYVQVGRAVGRRSIVAGGGAAFGPRYVHDVVNVGADPVTSVHAYSPPMESMNFYRQEVGGLVLDRTEYRVDPSWAP
jgi:predicted metal-dependent enzyme (double-stranded beta helix superfamily)